MYKVQLQELGSKKWSRYWYLPVFGSIAKPQYFYNILSALSQIDTISKATAITTWPKVATRLCVNNRVTVAHALYWPSRPSTSTLLPQFKYLMWPNMWKETDLQRFACSAVLWFHVHPPKRLLCLFHPLENASSFLIRKTNRRRRVWPRLWSHRCFSFWSIPQGLTFYSRQDMPKLPTL